MPSSGAPPKGIVLVLVFIVIMVLYASPYLLSSGTLAGEALVLLSFGVPLMTSLLLTLFFGYPGLIVSTTAHVIGLIVLRSPLLWVNQDTVTVMIGVIIAVQLATIIIASLGHSMRSQVNEVKETNERLTRLSLVDDMTGAFNYRYFMSRLETELALARRHDRPCGLLILDLDRFKNFNDVHGHLAGDEALRRVVSVLQKNVRVSDIVARYGGEEFVVIAPDSRPEALKDLGDRLCRCVAEEAIGGGGRDYMHGGLTVSVGASVFPDWGQSVSHLLRQADRALYHAKQLGGDRTELFGEIPSPTMINNSKDVAVLAAVDTLMRILSDRDGYTFGHSRRVMKLCEQMGEALGFDEERMRTLQWAALVHDLGKIEVSRSLLLKPGELDDEDWKLMMLHPEVSAQIIEPVAECLTEIVSAIRDHHERYDGTGYPRGIRGEDIPLTARVLAVADAVDAMSSERPYRRCLSEEQVVEELNRGKGTQFDPKIADVAIRLFGKDQPVATDDPDSQKSQVTLSDAGGTPQG